MVFMLRTGCLRVDLKAEVEALVIKIIVETEVVEC